MYMIILVTLMSTCINDHASELHLMPVIDVTQQSVVSDLKLFAPFSQLNLYAVLIFVPF